MSMFVGSTRELRAYIGTQCSSVKRRKVSYATSYGDTESLYTPYVPPILLVRSMYSPCASLPSVIHSQSRCLTVRNRGGQGGIEAKGAGGKGSWSRPEIGVQQRSI